MVRSAEKKNENAEHLQALKEEYAMLQKIEETYNEVKALYESGEWESVVYKRHIFMQYIESAIEKKLQPDELVLSQPFTL